jgi:hypothetical protein
MGGKGMAIHWKQRKTKIFLPKNPTEKRQEDFVDRKIFGNGMGHRGGEGAEAGVGQSVVS